MALSSSMPSIYPVEQQTYISTACIKLKPSMLRDSTKVGDNMIFEWHTNVNTPPNTPANRPPVREESIEASQVGENHSSLPMRSLDLFTPAFTFDEQDDLKTQLDKFMSCERYHSQYHQMYQVGTQL